MPVPLQQLTTFLDEFAPPSLAESWDNVGLLLGDSAAEVQRVMTCLTLTPDVAEEAVAEQADLIVSHHPILFKPVQRITSDTGDGQMLLMLAQRQIAVYSPHTAFDSARLGINQQLAELLELREIQPLRPMEDADQIGLGSGRFGTLPRAMSLGQLLTLVRSALGLQHLQYVGDPGRPVTRLGIACGSAAEFLPDARRQGCDAFLTGEARFHSCLDARSLGVALILAGHYGTERPGVEKLAEHLQQQFPAVQVWASRRECDPLLWSLGG